MLLVKSLEELNDLIGNNDVKQSIAKQVNHLIATKTEMLTNSKMKPDDSMLNTVLYGPPGTGKTLVSKKLANIMYALGYLDNAKVSKKDTGAHIKDALAENGMGNSPMIVLYVIFLMMMVLASVASVAWTFYAKFGGLYTAIAGGIVVAFIAAAAYYMATTLEDQNDISASETENAMKGDEVMEAPRDLVKACDRTDFVDKYVGWTGPKTKRLLQENLGKVVFIDEAYMLITGPGDDFGKDALTTMNQFMSEHPGEIIIIMAGYRDKLTEGVFREQPGLKRRFMWQFDCNGYDISELFEIFKFQIEKSGWKLDNEIATLELFKSNSEMFPAFGGSTEKLMFYSKTAYSSDFTENPDSVTPQTMKLKHIRAGFVDLRNNDIGDSATEKPDPLTTFLNSLNDRSAAQY